ncbi:uncharacterized protein B0I36DRAFT_316005 [Microdochium trichocladiopsis]|uniref:Secreted protein n=1 Tax=Microdochium trichocladiopsis TaxID=1682393 RepID=A0A9P9BV64_9PEZI|nr:uncharacterized protein B0I36DRAFT_316005 [Microdochium trichocladiopsis]KAH7038321.1 hypothetical protein B0I36DRAFT_316005 [Microdochium trichocladiopsis]
MSAHWVAGNSVRVCLSLLLCHVVALGVETVCGTPFAAENADALWPLGAVAVRQPTPAQAPLWAACARGWEDPLVVGRWGLSRLSQAQGKVGGLGIKVVMVEEPRRWRQSCGHGGG